MKHHYSANGHTTVCGHNIRKHFRPWAFRTWGPVTCKRCLRYKDAIDVEELQDAIEEHGEEALACSAPIAAEVERLQVTLDEALRMFDMAAKNAVALYR